jgi:predicted metal-binding protein
VPDAYIERMSKSSVVTARLRRASPVLVCKKCLGRIEDGKQLRKSLKSELKQRAAAQAVKPPRVVLTNCLGVCPKRAVVVASPAMLERCEVLLLADAEAAAEAAVKLMPTRKEQVGV